VKNKMTIMNKKCLSNWLTALGIAALSLGSLVTMTQPALADSKWVDGKNGTYPPEAVVGGSDNGETLYVCKTRLINATGKLHPKYGNCYVSYGGRELESPNYQVLVGDNRWVAPSASLSLPPDALVGGFEDNGDPLYICKANLRVGNRTLLTPGKYSIVNKICYVPYGRKEHNLRPTEILTGKIPAPAKLSTDDFRGLDSSSGYFLSSNMSLYSTNGIYELIMQNDGNLVFYKRQGGRRSAVWSSGTWGKRVSGAVMRSDGNLVIFNTNNEAIWSSKTSAPTDGAYSSKLIVHDEGNVGIYRYSSANPTPVMIWTTNYAR
jgi:Protein of unknown function (DUF3421)